MRSAAAVMVAATVAGCSLDEPYVRSNPFDPGSIYAMDLVGPDSVHALGAEFAMSLATEPALPHDDYLVNWVAFRWMEPTASGQFARFVLSPRLPGRYYVAFATARYRDVSIGAYFNDVAVGHRVWVGQKAATLVLSCAPTILVPCTGSRAVESTVQLHPLMTDPLGNVVEDPKWAVIRASVTSRDPGVVVHAPVPADSHAFVRVRGSGAGTAWVVVDIDGAKDSVSLTFAPPTP